MKSSKDKTLQIRVTAEEKCLLDRQAADIGVSTSQLLRKKVFSEDKVFVLSSGKEIAATLYQVLSIVQKSGNSQEALQLLCKCEEQLCLIAEKLSDLSEGEEEP